MDMAKPQRVCSAPVDGSHSHKLMCSMSAFSRDGETTTVFKCHTRGLRSLKVSFSLHSCHMV